MYKFAKFAITGVLNTAVDLVTLNILVAVFTVGANGEFFLILKSISFALAVTNSYLFNKYWVFRYGDAEIPREFALFVMVSVVGLLCNVTVSSLAFHFFHDWVDLASPLAVNMAALAGTAAVLLWNFSGYKFIVFKEKNI